MQKFTKMKKFCLSLLLIFTFFSVHAQTAINSSFETTDGYNVGTVNNQNKWKVTTGTGEVSATATYAKTGSQGLRIASSSSAVQTEFIPYAQAEVGLKADVYVDFWIKFNALPSASFSITGYDLESSSHRSFMIDFLNNGKLKIYNGGSGMTPQPDYTINTWTRITVKIDNNGGKYQLAINGVVYETLFTFREIRNSASVFEFNSIRFSMGSGVSDVAVDDMYIGTSPVSDISFVESSTDRTITISQPSQGIISVSPIKGIYQLGESVTATITVPEHYIFNNWTGDVSGNSNPTTFTVDKNMSIGASVIVDPLNPPASSTITVNQPAVGGTIVISPVQSIYYNGTSITATLNLQTGFSFDGWTGSFTGTTNPKTFVLSENTIIGAEISEIPVSSTVHTVSTAAQLKTAIAAMNPGDTIVALDGSYSTGNITITRSGTSLNPIIIKSKNLHGAKIMGSASFTLSQISNVTIEGFDIDVEPRSTIFKMEGCSYVRITRNWLRMKNLSADQSSKWITIGDAWENAVCNSHHNRIDHNLFDGKYDSGAWVVIDGSHGSVPDITKYDRIDHNIFRNNTPRVANEKETIRVGVSDLSVLSAYCTIENNLFEDCDGDPEIVSVKSCDNIVRNNTFRRCLGTLSLRHGNRTLVEGNYFFGEGKTGLFEGNTIGCGGVRVYGKGHVITNNYMEGLTGSKWDAACTITNGDVTNTSTSLSSHFLPENLVFAYNTLVNNKSNIEIGFTNNGSYGKAPINCVIANNIVTASENPLILSYSLTSLGGVSFNTNIMFPDETATLGLTGTTDSQIKIINPLLVKSDCRAYGTNCEFKTPNQVYKLSPTSPAINASVGYQTIVTDFEGQPAVGIRDIGADEYNANAEITNGPWNETQVGPTAPESYVYEIHTATGIFHILDNQLSVFPNPFVGNTTIKLNSPTLSDGMISIYNFQGQLVRKEKFNFRAGVSEYKINTEAKGILYCVFESANKKYTVKLISE